MTTSWSTLESFFGLLALGAIPVPAAPPVVFGNKENHATLLGHIVRATGAKLILCDASGKASLSSFVTTPVAAYEELTSDHSIDPTPGGPDDIAFLQCTSGSTSAPKPVILLNRHVVAQTAIIREMMGPVGDDESGCSWLPLFHDMGLIGGLLGPVGEGIDLVLVPPERFIMKPISWFRVLSAHRSAWTVGPFFGYSLAAKRIPEAQIVGLDLSHLRSAIIGSDPIDAATLDQLAERFAPAKLHPDALLPAFGLAEASLAVTATRPGEGRRIDHVDPEALARGEAVPVEPGSPTARRVVGCGRLVIDTTVKIVAPDGSERADRVVGEVRVKGPSIMAGYYGREDATAEALKDGWLCTGDLGYMADGHLYIVGRIKNMIIVRGRNYFPEDIEEVVEEVHGVRRGTALVFEGGTDGSGSEKVYLVAESPMQDAERQAELERVLKARVFETSGLKLDAVRLVPPKTLTKTTSGKKQRSKARDALLAELRGETGNLWGAA